MSPEPAASSRFIAYSGEVCRNSGAPVCPDISAFTLPMFTSDTGALTRIGVSTSSTARARKNSRVVCNAAARRRSVATLAVGRQVFKGRSWPRAQRADAFAHAQHAAGGERRLPLDGAWREQQDHGGSHVEPAHFRRLVERGGRED